MAGDWIKMRGNLWDDPRVARLCDITDQPEAAIVGGLYWLWATADQHTEDGIMPGLTLRAIDRKTGIPGFGQGLCDIGWLADHPEGVRIVNFEEHNGQSAKRRCTDAQRKANSRSVSASEADNARTDCGRDEDEKRRTAELEKRREEKKETPPNPRKRGQVSARFEEFWAAWPKNERKQDKAKCAEHWRRNGLDAEADAVLADVRVKRATEKWREGFIEAPLVYLRGKRWQDGVTPNDGPAESAVDWRATWKTIVAKGIEVGCGEWSEALQIAGKAPDFPAYRAKVERRVRELEGAADEVGQQRIAGLMGGLKVVA